MSALIVYLLIIFSLFKLNTVYFYDYFCFKQYLLSYSI